MRTRCAHDFTPNETLQELVHGLADALAFEFALVGLLEPDGCRIRTIAGSARGVALEMRYALAGSPCELAVRDGSCVVRDGACERFPDDAELAAIGGRSYVGRRFDDPVTGRVAIVAAMSTRAIEDERRAETILRTISLSVEAVRRSQAWSAQNALVREALATAGQGYLLVDRDGTVLSESVEARALLRPGDDDDGAKLAARLGRGGDDALLALARGETFSGRVRVASGASGGGRTVELQVVPRDGERPGAFVLVRDLTRSAEQTERLQLALDATGAGLWDWRIRDDIVVTDGHYFRMLGHPEPPGPIGIDRFFDGLHPDDRAAIESEVARVFAATGSAEYDVDFRLRKADGDYLWVRSFGRVVERDESGAPLRMIGYHVDADQEHRRADRLARVEQRLRLFVENTPAPVAMLDRELRFMTASRGYLEHHGLAGVEGRPFREVFPWASDDWLGLLQRAIAGETLSKARSRRRRRSDGRPYHVRWKLEPWRDARREIGGVVVHLEPIDDQLESERRLAEARDEALAASRARGEFLANVSHEIRTPMTAICGFADMLDDPELAAREREAYIRTIRRNGEHLLGVIDAVLDLSKIDAGKLEVEAEPVDLAAVLGDLVRTFGPRAKEKGLALVAPSDGAEVVHLATDALRLRQILTNLVGNAVKFTERGEVRLSVRRVGADDAAPSVEIGVTDTGIGMTADQLAHVFEPFVQADGSSTRRFGGTGLGLSISRRLAELLGGHLFVASGPGQGTSFRLVLPVGIDARDPAPVATLAPTPASTSAITSEGGSRALDGVRVLVAEDGEDNQRLVRLILQRAGAAVTVVPNGALVRPELEDADAPYDLVLMDMQMPVMDGYEATGDLRASGWTLPVVALTAHALDEDRAQCLAAGCDDFVTKPVHREVLIDAVRRALGDRDERRAA